MKTRRILVIALVASVSWFGNSAAFSAEFYDAPFLSEQLSSQPGWVPGKSSGVLFYDLQNAFPGYLSAYEMVDNKFQRTISFCNSLSDEKCEAAVGFRFSAQLPACFSDRDLNCIESVSTSSGNSDLQNIGKVEDDFAEAFPSPYESEINRGLPLSGSPTIWNLPGAIHGGGTSQYLVTVSLEGEIPAFLDSAYKFGQMTASIIPVTIKKDQKFKPSATKLFNKDGINTIGTEGGYPGCVAMGLEECAFQQAFPKSQNFRLSIRLSRVMPGWIHGRISDPNISYQVTNYGSRIEVSGAPAQVPVFGGNILSESLSLEVKNNVGFTPEPGSTISFAPYQSSSTTALSKWAKVFEDKSFANSTKWMFYNLTGESVDITDNCIKDAGRLSGFLTTNSTTYEAGPPVFNKTTQSLDYKVASAHYLKDGSVFLGQYDLFIDSKVARCIFRFSSAPISATISIVTESGEIQVATTTVRESENWIHLAAFGFTFSDPTIRVRLAQKTTEQASNQSLGKSDPKQKLPTVKITCVKGKTSKKVTGSKPVCPAGFKKK